MGMVKVGMTDPKIKSAKLTKACKGHHRLHKKQEFKYQNGWDRGGILQKNLLENKF